MADDPLVHDARFLFGGTPLKLVHRPPFGPWEDRKELMLGNGAGQENAPLRAPVDAERSSGWVLRIAYHTM